MSELKIKSVMTTRVECVDRNDTLGEALSRMASKNISCLIVVDSNRPAGIFTERDVVRLCAANQIDPQKKMQAVMRSPVYSISAELSLSEAAKLMQINGFRRFPVVDKEGSLTGIVTQTDIMQGTIKTIEDHSQHLERMVRKRTEALERKNRLLEKLSTTDSLTGLANRRDLFRRLEEELARCRRHGEHMTCMMMDIDHFKSVNDIYGHDFGDEVIRMVAQAAKRLVRQEDVVGRYGGEEFVIFGQCNIGAGMLMAERIREAVSLCGIPSRNGVVSVTISIGVAEYDPIFGPDNPDDLLRLADIAMYEAKKAGRNCVRQYKRKLKKTAA